MTAEANLLLMLLSPMVGAVLTFSLAKPPGLRDVLYIGAVLVAAGASLGVVHDVASGERVRVVLAQPLPYVELAFVAEPLSALIGASLCTLGALHAFHSVGFVRAVGEPAANRLLALVALALSAALASTFAANLFTLFAAYQALLLIGFPLVAHSGAAADRARAGLYLAILLSASVGLLLPAIVWTYAVAGTLEFEIGGLLSHRVDAFTANSLLVLYVAGAAMCALPPMHRWVTASANARFPALVSLYALSVLPIGAVTVLKIVTFVFGAALNEAVLASRALVALAGTGMCAAALIALSKPGARERLAYSAMAQALAVLVGALLANPAGLFAASLQVVAFACAASTLLMAVGSTYAVTGRETFAEYAGLGRVMPWTFAGFAVAAASLIGLPPFAGAWAKLWLITSAAGAGLLWAAALVAVAAMLTFAHLGPAAARALSEPPPENPFRQPDGAPILLTAPVALGALATLSLLILADPLASFLSPIWTPP
jgi:multicomponent Na+:H+ antiporter subunit D